MTVLKRSCTDRGGTSHSTAETGLHSVWPEFKSLFLPRVDTAVCGAGSVLVLYKEGFPVGFQTDCPESPNTFF